MDNKNKIVDYSEESESDHEKTAEENKVSEIDEYCAEISQSIRFIPLPIGPSNVVSSIR